MNSIERAWHKQARWLYLLAPLSALFWCLSSLRRALFKLNIRASYKLNVPVIVVGNISIGGNGKTPTVLGIVEYLKSQGYLEKVNNNHMHDLAKFMFGVSVFWAYLWFSQFMLIWYANIPEEVTYFVTRIEDYPVPFWGMLVTNLIFPFFVLMNSDYKRINWLIVMTGLVILFGHYLDFYNMIMPATVGDQWYIGIPEIGGIMFFAGLFIYIVFSTISKVSLEPSGDPLFKESEKFVY